MVLGCTTVSDARDVIWNARADAGDFAYLDIRYDFTNMHESPCMGLLALFSEADPVFKKFAGTGCDN